MSFKLQDIEVLLRYLQRNISGVGRPTWVADLNRLPGVVLQLDADFGFVGDIGIICRMGPKIMNYDFAQQFFGFPAICNWLDHTLKCTAGGGPCGPGGIAAKP